MAANVAAGVRTNPHMICQTALIPPATATRAPAGVACNERWIASEMVGQSNPCSGVSHERTQGTEDNATNRPADGPHDACAVVSVVRKLDRAANRKH